jgi:fucokinase
METVEESLNPAGGLAAVARKVRGLYAACVAGTASAPPWWTAVVITASSRRQAEGYEAELKRRHAQGRIPAGVRYLVVPDLEGRRIGSGGATLNALCALAPADPLENWWAGQRVLMIHSGGDSRRLPQYSLSGKLFSAVPVRTPWGEPSTVFDEMLALSTAWVERLPCGLVVSSGDVILTFDAATLDWSRSGVSGVAILQPAAAGTQHGVYITDERGRVYSFLQKPSVAALTAAGGLLPGGQVALDSGLLCFSPEVAARLMRMAGPFPYGRGSVDESRGSVVPPAIDLYQHMTMALTGQWRPEPQDAPTLHAVFEALDGVPFWCSVVAGDFTHIGTTSLFRRLMTEDTEFSRLYAAQQRLGATRQPDVRSSGVVIDSVLAGGADLGAATVAIECDLAGLVRAAAGSVLHGLDGIAGTVEVPENTVVHQVPVKLADGRRGVVIRVYGVEDDPKAAGAGATWFGRPILEELGALGLDPAEVWPGLPLSECSLWNARLFPAGSAEEAWACVRWMLRLESGYAPQTWRGAERLSLESSIQAADGAAIEAARTRRLRAYWRISALSLVESGADIRPLLANAPGTGPLAATGHALRARAAAMEADAPTEAASREYTAGLFLGQAGLAGEAEDAHAAAFRLVQRAVNAGAAPEAPWAARSWCRPEVAVEAPARIDLGGGWSDTPPFCLDWGGTVLNLAVLLDGAYPIQAAIRTLPEPVVRCTSGETGSSVEYRTCGEILAPPSPGDDLSIPRSALRMSGLFTPEEPLAEILGRMGGGIEIRTAVNLPMGSGLGTSSILAAAILRALWELRGVSLDDHRLSEQVTRLEQLMTTGGGWQDQAGGIFPGAKLLVSGPGLHQRIRVQPVPWTAERAADFESRLVLYYTGIRRIARNLLRQVVGRYLARETSAVQVLHSIKTLAMEMSYALQEGEWERLGALLDRHWELNQVLDPNTTNAPIHRLLERVRPYIHGAKLAGAGGGGFLILIGRSPEAATDLCRFLRQQSGAEAGVHACRIAAEGLRCRVVAATEPRP